MIYQAHELKTYLTYLTLAGQNEDGSLEFMGNDKAWDIAKTESACATCLGVGQIEIIGDGDGFECDVISYKPCLNCNKENE